MPTVFTHPAIPLAVRAVTGGTVTSGRLVLTAALCSVVPDLDAIGFFVGVPYASLFGHRGLTHSLPFALLLALCALPFAKRLDAGRRWTFVFVFLGTASHGLLDALTDDGLGVAFFSPFSNERYFFPWRPLATSPIGFSGAFSSSEIRVLASELLFVWLPCLLVALAARTAPMSWLGRTLARRTRPAGIRSGLRTSVWTAVRLGTILVVALTLGSAGTDGRARLRAGSPDGDRALLAEAIENLEKQAAKLAFQADPACPQDFAALETGRTLRISMFWGYDEHEGRARDRFHAGAMSRVLTRECRDRLSACGFARVSRAGSAERLTRTIAGREVEVSLFTSSRADDAAADTGLLAAYREQERLSRSAKDHFYRELVESDVVFYMGHSRLGGSIGFDDQSGVTTVVNAVLRRPMRPVLAALRHRPTRLGILGLFSCDSNRYFRRAFQDANPALTMIVTTGDIRYAPAEQTSLGALEAVLSKSCGSAFRESMISVTEPDPTMTYLVRGR